MSDTNFLLIVIIFLLFPADFSTKLLLLIVFLLFF